MDWELPAILAHFLHHSGYAQKHQHLRVQFMSNEHAQPTFGPLVNLEAVTYSRARRSPLPSPADRTLAKISSIPILRLGVLVFMIINFGKYHRGQTVD